jgi:predicted dehydrogenase/carbonic anhydrase/acetyltransferase-like protein (isoleucine patch superfamily)
VSAAPVRVGVVGLGYWGPNLARNFDRVAELAWCCDLSEERRARTAALYPRTRVTADLEELLADDDLDAVVVATSVPTHHAVAMRALEAGKHTFVEKPLATSSAEARELVAAADRAGVRLMTGHLLLFHPGLRLVRDLLHRGELGELYYLYGNRQNLGKVRADENALWSLGAHDVAVLLDMVGARPTEVWARGESYVRPGVEDVVFGYLSFPSGAVAHLHLSWLDPHKMRRLTVVGSDKMAVFDDMEADRKVTVYDKGVSLPPTDTYGEYVGIRTGDIWIPNVASDEPLRRGRGARGDAALARARRRDRRSRHGLAAVTLRPDPRGPNLLVGDDVVLGDDVEVGANVVLHDGCRIGAGARLGDGAVLGKRPHLSARSTASRAPLDGLVVEEGCVISTYAIVFAGTTLGAETIVGDRATIRERCRIGPSTVVGAGAFVENDTEIGARVRIQADAYITAYCLLEDDVFIAPCVVTTNDNFMGRTERRHELMRGATIRRAARVGGAAVLLPGIEVGEEAFVGAGSVVTRDVPPRVVVVGSPARYLRDVPVEELVEPVPD